MCIMILMETIRTIQTTLLTIVDHALSLLTLSSSQLNLFHHSFMLTPHNGRSSWRFKPIVSFTHLNINRSWIENNTAKLTVTITIAITDKAIPHLAIFFIYFKLFPLWNVTWGIFSIIYFTLFNIFHRKYIK